MSHLLIIACIVLLVTAAAWMVRRRKRKQLEAQFRKLAARADRPVNTRLEPRRDELVETIGNVLRGLEDGSARPGDVARVLPKFHRQVARLDHDQQAYDDVEASRTRLRQWLDRLEGHPPGSDFQDLKDVARKAHRIVSTLVEEGDLAHAIDASVGAEILLKQQHEALLARKTRLDEIVERIRKGTTQAERCNAPILVRPRWERLMASTADLDGLERQGKLAGALATANRVLADLDALTADLLAQVRKQVVEQQAQAASILADLLLWPPDEDDRRTEVHEMLDQLEQPYRGPHGEDGPPTLDTAREALEQANTWIERGVALAVQHKARWQAHLEACLERLGERPLDALDTFPSLPDKVRAARKDLDRRRQRLHDRLPHRPPWHVAEDTEEILSAERQILEEVEAIVSKLETRLEALSSRPASAARLLAATGVMSETPGCLQERFSLLEKRLHQRDLATLEKDVEQFDADLEAAVETAKQAGLEQAQTVLEAMDRALAELDGTGLATHAGMQGDALRKDRAALAAHLEKKDVLAALETAGTWRDDAQALVLRAKKKRNETRLAALLKLVEPGPALSGIEPAARAEVEGEFASIRSALDALSSRLEDQEAFDTGCDRLEQRLDAVRRRIEEALEGRFIASYEQHGTALARLTKSTVQFYLPDEAHEALAEARKLREACTSRTAWQVDETLEHTRRLLEQRGRLEALWEEALPRARRFYSRQLNVIRIELGAVEPKDLPSDITSELRTLEKEASRLGDLLETERWEEVGEEVGELSERVRALADRTEALRNLYCWHGARATAARRLVVTLESVGCDREARAVANALDAWDATVAGGSPVEQLRHLRAELEQLIAAADTAARRAVEEIERSKREQGELEAWRQVLGLRKRDLDWTRSSLKQVLGLGPEGIDLRRGLGILQAFQRALDIVNLDLEAAARHDRRFQEWLEQVRARAERRFREDFREVLDALHECPSSPKALCAEVLTHVDSVLSAGFLEDGERDTYEHLQSIGDDYHKLFGKRFSFEPPPSPTSTSATSATLVPVGPVMTRSPSASKK